MSSPLFNGADVKRWYCVTEQAFVNCIAFDKSFILSLRLPIYKSNNLGYQELGTEKEKEPVVGSSKWR